MIRIDWSGNFKTQESTELTAFEIFEENQKRLGIQCKNQNPAMCFRQLIRESYEKYGKKVVILIDEYDKPILDNLDNIEQAKQRRDFLRGMYGSRIGKRPKAGIGHYYSKFWFSFNRALFQIPRQRAKVKFSKVGLGLFLEGTIPGP